MNLLAAFEGGLLDRATGLEFIDSRAYDPTMGLFLQQAPAGFSAGDPNLYLDNGDDPVDAGNPADALTLQVEGRPILTFGLKHPSGPVRP